MSAQTTPSMRHGGHAVQTTFPRLMLEHAAQRPEAPAMREKDYGIWQTTELGRRSPRWCASIACGLAAAGLQRGEHIVVVGDNRPRLYAAMLAAQSLGAVPVPLYQDAVGGRVRVPDQQRRGRASRSSRTRSRSTSCSRCASSARSSRSIWYDDPRGLRNYDEPGLASLDALIEAGRACDAAHPGFFDAEVATTEPDDVAAMFFTSGTTGQPEGRGAHPLPRCSTAPRPAPTSTSSTRRRGGAGLPAAGLGRPEHLQLRAVAGLRLRRQLPRVGRAR